MRIALIEKGIEFEPIEIDMSAREHRNPKHLALNPYRRVPTIEENGLVLYESAAILQYLGATRPAPALVPADPCGRALVDMHLRLCDGQMGRHVGTIIFPKRFLPPEKWHRPAMEVAKSEIEKHFAILEETPGFSPYLVADTFTLADIAYLPFLHFLPLMEIAPGPRIAEWRLRLLARPSAQAIVPMQ